ncbi:MFS transporter [Caballeronia sp. dw_19]|jgi:ACS family D-galactonate transporter-like MFS transporter|uniref:MFS transporter n=1 Tax=unclassified Caballeronia TaxID=2646786 RepID=UPI001BCFB021|nr:MFS transporter [Caballeronia sp. dw_19]
MKATRSRFFIVFLLFVVTAINYMDRANLSIAGSKIQGEFGLSPSQLGLLFSAFTWTYAASQIPVGYLLDRIGSRILYGTAIVVWSACTFAMGFSSHVIFTSLGASFAMLIICRALIGLAEAPSFLSNTKIIASWFPKNERARATSIYISSQYIGLAVFTPVLTFLTDKYGWEVVFYSTGGVGVIFGIYWLIVYRDPKDSKTANAAELDLIKAGGGYGSKDQSSISTKVKASDILYFLKKKTIWGLFITQFAYNSTLMFFMTWFIVYLEKALNLSLAKAGIGASIPFMMAMVGMLTGGFLSDMLLKKGKSVTFARKTPVILGLALTSLIFLVNFFESDPVIAIAILSLAFFGNNVANIGWVVFTDVIPRNFIGTMGGFLNLCGNLSGITTPIIFGLILQRTNNFHYAMWYVSVVAILGILSYIFLVGKIEVIVPPPETKSENEGLQPAR